VLAEVVDRLMMIEAVEAELVSPGNVAKKLRAKPDVVRQLHRYQERVARVPLMGIQVTGFDLTLLLASTEVRRRHGFLTNDSLVAASARVTRCEVLATGDADLERIEDLSIYRPDDLRDAE
jgi:predicted nucleic acid-binding protein